MSEASAVTLQPESKPERKKGGPKLTEAERRAIVAEVATGKRQVAVAKQFNVSPNTVWSLVKSVRSTVNGSALTADWRRKLTETLPAKSVDAIERSIGDVDDPHKAASTAIAHLKGIGVLASENQTNVNVFVNQIANLPADWQQSYLGADDAETIETKDVTGE